MVVVGNYLWLYGGLSLSKGPLDTLARYWQLEHFTLTQRMHKELTQSNELLQRKESMICRSVVVADFC